MSADKFDRVTAIASRQTALHAKRHIKPAEVLHYELIAMTLERDELAKALRELFFSCDTKERSEDGTLGGVRVPDRAIAEQARALLARIKGGG